LYFLLIFAIAINPCIAAAADDEDARMIAKMLYGECRGVASETERAACAWVLLNRVDADKREFGGAAIASVLTKKRAFAGYKPGNPVKDELLCLAHDVLERWEREKAGERDVGRVIPNDYFWFTGAGCVNRFRNVYKGSAYWDWLLASPYET
jgi:hypothetical protein